MSRYIDADKLIDDIRPFAEYDSNRSNKDWVRRFEIAIETQQTANVVEIVRCKDCKWHLNGHLCKQLSQYGSIETPPDFYCSFGERAEE